MTETIKQLTPRNWGQSLDDCIARINAYLFGWIEFFGICSEAVRRTLQNLDAHIRRRLRAILLRQWGKKRYIVRQLIRLGVKPRTAWHYLYEGCHKYWALSGCSAMNSGLNKAYFAARGLRAVELLWATKHREQVIDPAQLRLALE